MAGEPTRYASVTAILSGGIPKPALTRWAAKAVAEAAAPLLVDGAVRPEECETLEGAVSFLKEAPWRISSAAADLGSHVHRYVEAHNLGKPSPEWPLPVRPFMAAFEAWVADYSPAVEAAEMRLYSRRHRYAGTCDLIATIDGRRFIIDAKSGRGVYGEAAVQLASYARCDFCIIDPQHPGTRQITPARGGRWYEWHGPPEDEHPLPEIEAGGILHLRPEGYAWYPNVDISEASFEVFLSAQAVHEWISGASRTALGRKAPAPDRAEQAIAKYGAVV